MLVPNAAFSVSLQVYACLKVYICVSTFLCPYISVCMSQAPFAVSSLPHLLYPVPVTGPGTQPPGLAAELAAGYF